MQATARIFLRTTLGGIVPAGGRAISVSAVHNIKEIRENRVGKRLIVEGVYLDSDRLPLLVKPEIPIIDDKKPCYMCALDLDIKHTDVMILSQFLRSDGCILPRRITGLCSRQQKRIGTMIKMAQKAGLMMNINPANSSKDPTKRRDWKAFYSYYDETTIFQKNEPKKRGLFKYLRNIF